MRWNPVPELSARDPSTRCMPCNKIINLKEFDSASDQVGKELCITLVFTEKAREEKELCWHKYLRHEAAVLVDIFLHNKEEGKRWGIFTHQCMWEYREQKARSVLNKSQGAEGLMDLTCVSTVLPPLTFCGMEWEVFELCDLKFCFSISYFPTITNHN